MEEKKPPLLGYETPEPQGLTLTMLAGRIFAFSALGFGLLLLIPGVTALRAFLKSH